jgi:hypothetical protein
MVKTITFHTEKCKECGSKENSTRLMDTNDPHVKLMLKGYCWKCAFWLSKVDAGDEESIYIRMEGVHYIAHPFTKNMKSRMFMGFGGSKWAFRLSDGRTIISNNVWQQGEIPERFRDQMPDNATSYVVCNFEDCEEELTEVDLQHGIVCSKHLRG